MRSYRRTPPFRMVLGVGGLFSVGAAAVVLPPQPGPEVGALPAVYAAPAEDVEVRALAAGQTLGEMLSTALDPGEQQRLILAFREQASPRRMRVGTEITLRYLAGDEPVQRSLRGVDIALNPDSTVRLTRDGFGWSSATVETPTWTDTIYAGGVIRTALWNAVSRDASLAAVPPRDRAELIHHLDQIFQWQVDFSRQIQSGDRYRFAFERQVRPDGSMRTGRIVSAELVNAGTAFSAVWFDALGDGRGAYYDRDGNSVRRAFLLKPLEFRRISSQFSRGRYHPILKRWRAHQGVDYAADTGTPIMTTADGVVQHRGPKGGLGNAVIVRHANGYLTRYGHMSRFAPGVSVGSRVRQGDIIGYVGMTGLATGPHLHYELWRDGQAVDPLSMDLPTGEPIPAEDRDRWEAESAFRIALLDRGSPPSGVRLAAEASGVGAAVSPQRVDGPDR